MTTKPTARVDADGMVYDLRPRGNGLGTFLFVVFASIGIGVFGMLVWFDIPPAAILNPRQPMATAAPAKAPPAVRVNLEQPAPVEQAPTPDYEEAIRAYNAAQQERAAEFAAQDAQEGPGAAEAAPADIPTLVPEWHAPMSVPAEGIPSVCDSWHPPLAFPPECEAWRVPMMKP